MRGRDWAEVFPLLSKAPIQQGKLGHYKIPQTHKILIVQIKLSVLTKERAGGILSVKVCGPPHVFVP